MPTKDEKGRWLDGAGNAIPIKFIDPVDKKRDAMVEKLFRAALVAQERLRKFKELAGADVEKYLAWLAERNGEDALNPGGNYELPTFYGDKQICIKVNKIMIFDERLQLAKQKIDRCLELWSDGGNDKLKIVIFDAFKIDKKGNVDKNRILSLRRLEIKDDMWNEAMELISDAVRVTGTKTYIMFQERNDKKSNWETLRLDIAGV